jgi:hypothetical protein
MPPVLDMLGGETHLIGTEEITAVMWSVLSRGVCVMNSSDILVGR